MDNCESCKNFDRKDRYCKLLQINWIPENFGCNKHVSKENGAIECQKNCRECLYKTFDSDSSQEFICDLYGHPIY